MKMEELLGESVHIHLKRRTYHFNCVFTVFSFLKKIYYKPNCYQINTKIRICDNIINQI